MEESPDDPKSHDKVSSHTFEITLNDSLPSQTCNSPISFIDIVTSTPIQKAHVNKEKTDRKPSVIIETLEINDSCSVVDISDGSPATELINVIELSDNETKENPSDNDVQIISLCGRKSPSFKRELEILNANNEKNNNNNDGGRAELSGDDCIIVKTNCRKRKNSSCDSEAITIQKKRICEYDLSGDDDNEDLESLARVGKNVYIEKPIVLPKTGLRPIIIDGSNVAFQHSNNKYFSCKGLDICIKYFKSRNHEVVAFVPQFRVQKNKSDNPRLLNQLVRRGDVVLTPSRRIDGNPIVSYDDRYIVQTAVLKGGIIVTRDNYMDLLPENPAWSETIKYRILQFTWVKDLLIFPKDPLGAKGPSLEQFLRFG